MIVGKYLISSASLLRQYYLRSQYHSDQQMYKNMLQSYRTSMKKPTTTIKESELNILIPMLQGTKSKEEINQVGAFLVDLRDMKLFNVRALDLIEDWIGSNWGNFNEFNQFTSTCLLVEQGRYSIFNKNQSHLKQNLIRNHSPKPNERAKLAETLFKYCKYISQRQIKDDEALNKEVKMTEQAKSKLSAWRNQIELVSRAQNAIEIYANNEIEVKQVKRMRSNLEIEVEALLTTAGYKFYREINVLGYAVDFVVLKDGSQPAEAKYLQRSTKNCIIEVMGSHHYTVEQKLFGKDILRALILETFMPVSLVHASTINQMKGIQNKLEYINNIVNNPSPIKQSCPPSPANR